MINLSIGIIGAGYVSNMHSKAIRNVYPDIVQYVFDVNRERAKQFATDNKCVFMESLDEMMSCVDSLIIASSTDSHYKLSMEAMKLKKNLLCEKPMALSLDNAINMVEICKTYRLNCSIGYNYRFFDIVGIINNELDIGNWLKIKVTIERLIRNDWFGKGTGVLADLGTHLIDLIAYLCKSDISITSCSSNIKYEHGVDVYAELNGKTKNDVFFTMISARILDEDNVGLSLEIEGETGEFYYDSRDINHYKLKRYDRNECYIADVGTSVSDFFDFSMSICRQDKEWIDSILYETECCNASFLDGLKVQEVLKYIGYEEGAKFGEKI